MDVAKQLEEYRKNKAKKVVDTNENEELNEQLIPKSNSDTCLPLNTSNTSTQLETENNCLTYSDFLYYVLCLILWGTVYAIFIKLQFGTVYFIVSCLIGIYVNTRTSPKKSGEVSAYSVFNKDCKSIDGTLKAEQFEREIRYGRL